MLLQPHGYVKRKARKVKAMGPRHPDRNASFENIAQWKNEYRMASEPALSIEAKKKELPGRFYHDGKPYTQQPVEVFDQDLARSVGGVVFHTVPVARSLMERPQTRPA